MEDFGGNLDAAEEVIVTDTVEEFVAVSDLVGVGRAIDVQTVRVITERSSPDLNLQFANFLVDVESSSGDFTAGGRLNFELAISVSSPDSRPEWTPQSDPPTAMETGSPRIKNWRLPTTRPPASAEQHRICQ